MRNKNNWIQKKTCELELPEAAEVDVDEELADAVGVTLFTMVTVSVPPLELTEV